MCGVFGLSFSSDSVIDHKKLTTDIASFVALSSERGRGSVGLAVQQEGHVQIHKRFLSPKEFLRSKSYAKFLGALAKELSYEKSFSLIGQCRLSTSGSLAQYQNNQPIAFDDIVGVHNGIITRIGDQSVSFPEGVLTKNEKESASDSHHFFQAIQSLVQGGKDPFEAVQNIFSKLRGAANIGLLVPGSEEIILATNSGSIYYSDLEDQGTFLFASEKKILDTFIRESGRQSESSVRQLMPGEALSFDPFSQNIQK
ncbi:MAG: hypothetical protein AAF203_10015, partial [Pseudomonadota bacterium]